MSIDAASHCITGYRDRSNGPLPRTYRAHYSLSTLVEDNYLDRGSVNRFLGDTGLKDFAWHVIWAEDYPTTDDDMVQRLTDVDGYVIFAHGVTASWLIWEDLPGMVVRQNRRLVAISIDHNGFGETPFISSRPPIDKISPKATMYAIEEWFELLGLRRPEGTRQPKVINFVGHSMGGAALFYLREPRWRYGEQTRVAVAPAILLHDDAHRAFFNTVGFGAGIVERLRFLEDIENLVSHPTLRTLTDGATETVRKEHIRIYEEAAKGITARAMAAMGLNNDHPVPHYWELMRVYLAHRDALVGLLPAMDLMQELLFTVEQVRVVMGTHYLFSLGEQWKAVHEQNRALILNDILRLHEEALQRQRTG
jgi:pimeloyl-ACP methyl ester carboxylesterase